MKSEENPLQLLSHVWIFESLPSKKEALKFTLACVFVWPKRWKKKNASSISSLKYILIQVQVWYKIHCTLCTLIGTVPVCRYQYLTPLT